MGAEADTCKAPPPSPEMEAFRYFPGDRWSPAHTAFPPWTGCSSMERDPAGSILRFRPAVISQPFWTDNTGKFPLLPFHTHLQFFNTA